MYSGLRKSAESCRRATLNLLNEYNLGYGFLAYALFMFIGLMISCVMLSNDRPVGFKVFTLLHGAVAWLITLGAYVVLKWFILAVFNYLFS